MLTQDRTLGCKAAELVKGVFINICHSRQQLSTNRVLPIQSAEKEELAGESTVAKCTQGMDEGLKTGYNRYIAIQD